MKLTVVGDIINSFGNEGSNVKILDSENKRYSIKSIGINNRRHSIAIDTDRNTKNETTDKILDMIIDIGVLYRRNRYKTIGKEKIEQADKKMYDIDSIIYSEFDNMPIEFNYRGKRLDHIRICKETI